MSELWDEVFDSQVPEWLAHFDEAPAQALDDLFFRRFFHGHLQPVEPEDLLVDWIRMLSDTDFTARLDSEMQFWVERHWGGVPERRRVKRWADAWQCLANVVGPVDELPLTVTALRERFDEAHETLGPFSTSPSRDPLGRYLWAIAAHQSDRSLDAVWWSMCDLGDNVVFYHASYAIGGVAGLPPPTGKEGGGFREDVVHAVLRLGRAFDRLVARRRLQSKQAEEEYGVAVGWALAAFPFPDRWCDVLAPRWRSEPEWVRDRLVNYVHGLDKIVKRPPRRDNASRNWKQPTDRVVVELRRGVFGARREAEKLLGEARAHVEATGDSIPLNRALCRFSSTILKADVDQAIAWAEEAVAWEPWDAFSWTTLARAFHRARRLEEALVTSWRAVERFPQNVVARNGLGEVLKADGRREEAEAVYRETVERFPQDVVARTGLGEVLKADGRREEAEAVYRETVERFPENVVARNGLGEVLKADGRREEAEAVYRETVERFPENVVARTGLGGVLKADGRLEEAEAVYQETVERSAQDAHPRTGPASDLRLRSQASEQAVTHKVADTSEAVHKPELASPVSEVREVTRSLSSARDLRTRTARLFRHRARRAETAPEAAGPSSITLRERAGELLDNTLAERPHDVRALTEKGLLLLDSGAVGAARTLLDEHAGRLPAAALLWASLARAVREEARGSGRSLDDQAEGDVLRAPGHLHSIDHAYEPLVRLQEGRAYLALTDGAERLQGASRAFERLRRWVLHNQADRKTREFEPWYGAELRHYALAPIDVDEKVEPSHIEGIAACIEENARFVDALEEDFALRFT